MSAAPDLPRAQRSLALDGLRGYAAMAVVFYHTILGPNPSLIPRVLHAGMQSQGTVYDALLKLALAVCNGELAVSIFFVISGIVVFQALERMHAASPGAPATSWRFLLRRLLRLWPVMAVCLVAKVLLFNAINLAWPGFVEAPTAGDLAVNLALIRFPVNGATWTLLVEMAAAPVFLLLLFAMRGLGGWVLLAFGAYAMAALLKYPALLFHSPYLIAGLPFLLAGVAVARGWAAPLLRPGVRGPVAALALAMLAGDMLFVPVEWFKLHFGLLLASVPVLVGWVYTARAGAVTRVLRARVSGVLGRISFSLYLWNVPVFELMLAALPPDLVHAHPLEAGLLVGLAALVVTIPIAVLSERWLEQPSIRLGKLLTRVYPETSACAQASRIASVSIPYSR